MADFYSGNRYLTSAEMGVNAKYIYAHFSLLGWTLNSIAAMLGNMEAESTINPGIWESLDSSDPSRGYGLVQWTPSTKYTEWCQGMNLDPSHLTSACVRIEYECANGVQWIATDRYPLSFEDFRSSTADVGELAQAFLYNYERPASLDQPGRSDNARKWYQFLQENGGAVPGDPSNPNPTPGQKKQFFPLWLLIAATRRR